MTVKLTHHRSDRILIPSGDTGIYIIQVHGAEVQCMWCIYD